MRRRPVDSTSVRTVGWEDGVLEVEFASGSVYQYFLVPRRKFTALLKAPSIGGYVNRQIKPHHDFREV